MNCQKAKKPSTCYHQKPTKSIKCLIWVASDGSSFPCIAVDLKQNFNLQYFSLLLFPVSSYFIILVFTNNRQFAKFVGKLKLRNCEHKHNTVIQYGNTAF